MNIDLAFSPTDGFAFLAGGKRSRPAKEKKKKSKDEQKRGLVTKWSISLEIEQQVSVVCVVCCVLCVLCVACCVLLLFPCNLCNVVPKEKNNRASACQCRTKLPLCKNSRECGMVAQ